MVRLKDPFFGNRVTIHVHYKKEG